MTDRWCIVANVADPRSTKLRTGALVRVLEMNRGSGSERVKVRGISIGGRRIVVWIGSKWLRDARAHWAKPDDRDSGADFDTKDEATAAAACIARWFAPPAPAPTGGVVGAVARAIDRLLGGA